MSEPTQSLPPGWTACPIEELFQPLADGRKLHHGWSPQCDKEPAGDGEWGVLKTTAVQDGAFLPEHNKHLPTKLKPRAQFEVKQGDVLITCAGPRVRCGVPCLVRETRNRLILSGKMYRFRVRPEIIDSRYMEAYLRSPETQRLIDKMKTGISDSGLNLTHGRFFTLQVPVAPPAEQVRIVAKIEELFSDLDAGVAALERVRANLKRYRAAVLKAAVEGRLTEEWRTRHPATEPAAKLLERILAERRAKWEQDQLRKFKEAGKTPPKGWKEKYEEATLPATEDLPTLPREWRWSTVDQLISYLRNGWSLKPNPEPPGHRVLRISAVRSRSVDLGEVRFVPQKRDEVADYFIGDGDLLFTRYNGSVDLLGVCGLVRGCSEPTLHPDKLIRVKTVLGQPLNAYLEIASNVGESRRHMKSRARTTAGQTGISGPDVREMPIPLPPLAEQAEIVAEVDRRLSVADAAETQVEHALQRAARLRQAILKRAFEGKLVEQDPTDEPAAALLERIKAGSNGHRAVIGNKDTGAAKPAKRRSRAHA